MTNNVNIKLPTGIKNIQRIEEPMVGDWLLITFENGLSLSVNALHLAEDECGVALYDSIDGSYESEKGTLDVLAALDFGEKKPHPVIYHDTWKKFQSKHEYEDGCWREK